ncbi:hypothetical protein A3E72_05455 [Candidatus Gottesmanbacteria bacterium RIFCSPHIGHO2_12_FULL_43_26]|uniref:Glycosyltransferase 2-like domain-containing protein n=1 Tax=Candidatus Gottesmanbacteria bacterium RIFCSPLOWO2_01_FULL_42_22 TaxID=1798391 RepID=A0A1F6BHA5_9BACT|nr:MAG: hypothetical protein A3E72_05455 [Candidatus Gottesmanbacteria bacterium RIFCSPHIGHO2_12_FULL_43_26]OGG33343.1 MAG: hypothetical protein A3G68_02145 [Candidatus Gottesmanbacteria bacterium RIFCSPLOWO2_12_FULL_42_10]OGG36319.1 MAG: hypothetical protein A2968_06115 [Candidatus Gottesmanbacteria bacterium RIFCSPLOWO2_01_FULL_42_22]
MLKLSVVLATFNEEENIGKCLESCRGLASEIVVVDGSSTDSTREILKKYDARVLVRDNLRNFHINKQLAIENARAEWILQLDADEALSPKLKEEIKSVIDSGKDADGYWIPRKNYFLGRFLKKGGQYPDYTLRLYRRGKGMLPAKNVHEQAVVSGKTASLKNDLLHYSYPDFAHYLEHFNRYTDFLAEELEEQKASLTLAGAIDYLILKPKLWFIKTYFRHKGYADGLPGFTFSLFSALRYPVAYIKYWEKKKSPGKERL